MEIMDRDSGMLTTVLSHHAKQPTALGDGGVVKYFDYESLSVYVWFEVVEESGVKVGEEYGYVNV
jgi:hypothetical protein